MVNKDSKYYAVRFGDVVEIRAAINKPKEIVSRLVKETKVEKRIVVGTWPNQRWQTKSVPHKLIIEQTYYEGGKVLGIVKYNYFTSQAKNYDVSFNRMGMIEIPRALRMSLKGKMYL